MAYPLFWKLGYKKYLLKYFSVIHKLWHVFNAWTSGKIFVDGAKNEEN